MSMHEVLQNTDMVVEIGRNGDLELWGNNWSLVSKVFLEACNQYKKQIGARKKGEIAMLHSVNISYFWEYEPSIQNGDFVKIADNGKIYVVIPDGLRIENEEKKNVKHMEYGRRERSLFELKAKPGRCKRQEADESKKCSIIMKLPKALLPLIQDYRSFYENPYIPTETESRDLFYHKYYTLTKSTYKDVVGFSALHWCEDICVFAYTNVYCISTTYKIQEDDDMNVNGITL